MLYITDVINYTLNSNNKAESFRVYRAEIGKSYNKLDKGGFNKIGFNKHILHKL